MKKYVLTVLIALMIVPCVHAGNDYLQKLGGKKTMYAFLWKLEGEAYDQAHPKA